MGPAPIPITKPGRDWEGAQAYNLPPIRSLRTNYFAVDAYALSGRQWRRAKPDKLHAYDEDVGPGVARNLDHARHPLAFDLLPVSKKAHLAVPDPKHAAHAFVLATAASPADTAGPVGLGLGRWGYDFQAGSPHVVHLGTLFQDLFVAGSAVP